MLKPGDFAPDVFLPDQFGASRSVYSQDIAGQTLVVFVADPRTDGIGAWISSLESEMAAFESLETKLLLVLTAPDGVESDAGLSDNLAVYRDTGGHYLKAFGLTDCAAGPVAMVIDRNGRIIAMLADRSPDDLLHEAIEHCQTEHGRYPVHAVSTQAPVLLIPRILEPDECDKFVVHWAFGEKRPNEISSGSTTDNTAKNAAQIKRRADVVVDEEGHPLNLLMRTRIENRVLPELSKAFRFDTRAYDVIRIGCYDSADSGFFKPHRDLHNVDPSRPRKFALSLNLNDEFTGGEIRFPEYGAETYCPPRGGGIVFSCSLLHEALPVTSGQRFGLFLFFF